MTSILIPQKLLEPWAPDNAWALVIKNEAEPNPLTEEGFLHYEARLYQELSQAAEEPKKELLNSLLEAVDNLSLGVLGKLKLNRAVNKALKTFADRVLAVAPGIATDGQLDIARRSFDETAKEFASNQKHFAKSRRGLKKDAADKYENLGLEREFLLRNNAMFMGAYLRDSMPEKAKYAMTMAFQVGISGDEPLSRDKRTQLVQEVLEDKFRRLTDVPETYWKTYSANALNNARTYSLLKQFESREKEGVVGYRIKTVQDSKTSNICKALRGKTFEIKQALDRFHAFFTSNSLDEVKNISPMVNGTTSSGFYYDKKGLKTTLDVNNQDDLLAAGVSFPPFHFNCRSTIEPVYGMLDWNEINNFEVEYKDEDGNTRLRALNDSERRQLRSMERSKTPDDFIKAAAGFKPFEVGAVFNGDIRFLHSEYNPISIGFTRQQARFLEGADVYHTHAFDIPLGTGDIAFAITNKLKSATAVVSKNNAPFIYKIDNISRPEAFNGLDYDGIIEEISDIRIKHLLSLPEGRLLLEDAKAKLISGSDFRRDFLKKTNVHISSLVGGNYSEQRS